MRITTVSALYVRSDGPYPAIVRDWWGEDRDARLYDGPNPVVAHPPCARWGNFWWSARHKGLGLGDDDGCFAAAIASVRRFGGVLEHPRGSRAWPRFDLVRPERGAWTPHPERPDEWTAEVAQRNYGHRATKLTWLVYVGARPPGPLDWRDPDPPDAWCSTDRPMADLRAMGKDLMGPRERELSPPAFAAALVCLALGAR